jgi:hypothetical protein
MTYRCATNKLECDAKALIDHMTKGAPADGFKISRAGEHSCHAAVDAAVQPPSKRARKAVVGSAAGGRHYDDIRSAMQNRSDLLVSYDNGEYARMRPTSWATEPHTFWTKYINSSGRVSDRVYSLSVAKITSVQRI